MKFQSLIYIGCISLIILINSCKGGSDTTENDIRVIGTITYNGINKNLIPSIIDSLTFIPLYGSVEYPIGLVDDMQINDKGFFILDKRKNSIHAYSLSGERMYELKAIGQGAGEYLEIACFALTDSSLYLADNFKMKINEYDINDGKYKRSHESPVVTGGIRALKNDGFLLAEIPLIGINETETSNGDRLFMTDRNFRVKDSMYTLKDRDRFAMPAWFTGNDSIITYATYGYNGFTVINPYNGEITGNIALSTTKPYKPEDVAEMDLTDASDYAKHKSWQFLVSTPLNSQRYTILDILDMENDESSVLCVYDKKNNELYFNPDKDCHNLLISPDAVFKDQFYTVYNLGADILDIQLASGFNAPPHDVDSIIHKDGSAIICYTFRQ